APPDRHRTWALAGRALVCAHGCRTQFVVGRTDPDRRSGGAARTRLRYGLPAGAPRGPSRKPTAPARAWWLPCYLLADRRRRLAALALLRALGADRLATQRRRLLRPALSVTGTRRRVRGSLYYRSPTVVCGRPAGHGSPSGHAGEQARGAACALLGGR